MRQEVRIITEDEENRRNKGTLIFVGIILFIGVIAYFVGRTFLLSFKVSVGIGIVLFILLFVLIKFRKKIFKRRKRR